MTVSIPDADSRMRFRRAMGHYASGVTVITTVVDGSPVGATCQAFHSASLEPPLISVTLGATSGCLASARAAGRFAVNVLASDQEHLSRRFGQRGIDKWAGMEIEETPAGLPRLPGSLLTIECVVEAHYPAGDHVILLGRVGWWDFTCTRAGPRPLLFYRGDYRDLAPV